MILLSAFITLICASCTPAIRTMSQISSHAVITPIAKRSHRSRAWSICRRKYGKKLTGVTMKKGNRFICHYRKTKSQIRASCRKNHGCKLIDVIRKDERYICRFSPDATTGDKHFSTPDDQSADPGQGGRFNDHFEEHGPGTNYQQLKQNPAVPSPSTPPVTRVEKRISTPDFL